MKIFHFLFFLILCKSHVYCQSLSATHHSLFLCQDSTVYSTGSNNFGQLGLGFVSNNFCDCDSSYTQVTSLTNIVSVYAGTNVSYFIKEDGTVWSSGENVMGTLGIGNFLDVSTPTQILNLNNVKSINSYNGITFFVKENGSVWWVGNGNNIPQELTTITNVKKVYNTSYYTLFLKNDGTVWCSNISFLSIPEQIYGLTGIVDISIQFSSILKDIFLSFDGRVFTRIWDVPYLNYHLDWFPDLPFIKAISSSGVAMHTLFLQNEGSVWAMGDNSHGEFGTGTNDYFIDYPTPILLNNISNVKTIETGFTFSFFYTNDHKLYGTGSNYIGQFGDSSTFNSNLPVEILIPCNLMLTNEVSSSGIYGQLYADYDADCYKETFEQSINKPFNFSLNPGNNIVQSFTGGYWFLDSLPAGNYTITIDTSNTNWTPTCPITQSFTVVHPDSLTIAPSFGMVANNPCSSPKVSVNMPFMRPCFTGQQIHVQACNEYDATGILPDAYSIVELDPNLIFESASLPYTSLGNNQYRFEHDTLYPGQCVNYTISTQVDCNAPLGLTLCLEANLYPVADCVLDTIPTPPSGEVSPCTLPWDQSSLNVEGWCANDSIYFTITNTGQLGGGDMECYSPVRVFVDGVSYLLDSIKLLGGESFTYVFAGNGATWILEADQHPLHPGNSHPNAHVENCNPGNWTPDIVNNFPTDDADPMKDIYCAVVTGSYDPNDKKGTPYGLGAEHEVLPNQDIEYLIRFQNTGTDTAFTVVVRDTLDIDFDIFSVTPGSASHNYSFRMYGPRVLEWTFANILLPDSTTNEPLSNGFLSYRVRQKPNLADGTLLTNEADIYFDFNAPIITNETSHKVQRRTFEPTNSLTTLSQTKTGIKLYPNPTKQETILSFSTYQKQVSYKLLNLSGQVILEKSNLYGKELKVNLSEIPNGMYLMEVKTESGSERIKVVKE